MRLFTTAIPKNIKTLYFLSIPLFLLHIAEEYFTLYYPLIFGATTPYHLPKEVFIRTETIIITVLFVFAFMMYKKMFPAFLLLAPGLLYVFQLEHIMGALSLHRYYSGMFTGMLLIILGVFYWKELLVFFLRRKTSRS